MKILDRNFFDVDPITLSKNLLGKVIFHKNEKIWLAVQIIETEAYLLADKSSHAYKGFTEKRKAMFMPAGTIYMYYSRGKDSLNVSAKGEGNAVLIKSGIPYADVDHYDEMISRMHELNPLGDRKRDDKKLCSGQTLLCSSLNLKVVDWDQKDFDKNKLFVADVGYVPDKIIATTRLGLSEGKDNGLMYRFIDFSFADFCTKNILKQKSAKLNKDYRYV